MNSLFDVDSMSAEMLADVIRDFSRPDYSKRRIIYKQVAERVAGDQDLENYLQDQIGDWDFFRFMHLVISKKEREQAVKNKKVTK